MSDLELAVVGAGPQALTLLSYMAEYRPQMLQRTAVFDTQDWLASWHRQFATYRIGMLRSACVHHPHPHAYGLIDYARGQGRSAEFFGLIGRPSTQLFADYCDELLDGLQVRGLRVGQRVTDLRPLAGSGVQITTTERTWIADRAVLATNPVRPTVPSWLGDALGRFGATEGLLHAKDWEQGMRNPQEVVVVGGGLTAAQIVAAHSEVAERVTWLTRSPLRERDLDVDAPWLGPNLRRFHAVPDPGARVSMARKARGGGSVPEHERGRLSELVAAGRVEHLQAPVDRVRRIDGQWEVTVRHRGSTRALRAARVICATGSHTHVRLEPLLRRCRTERPVRRVGGLPALNSDLSWPGTTVHLMGPLALAQVGPASRTVIGARIAAERIVESWGCSVRRQYPGPRW